MKREIYRGTLEKDVQWIKISVNVQEFIHSTTYRCSSSQIPEHQRLYLLTSTDNNDFEGFEP